MSNILLHHILRTEYHASLAQLIERWCKLSIKNQEEIAIENYPVKFQWNEGYLECLRDLNEIIENH